MAKPVVNILTDFQIHVLKAISRQKTLRDFYLTGGTALAEFDLRHRLSEDLDFFTEVPGAVTRAVPVIHRLAKELGGTLKMGRRFETLYECSLIVPHQEPLKMDFALDMPGRLKPLRRGRYFGMRVDNALDMASNKLSALCERFEPKDFVDIYFIHQDLFPLPQLLHIAKKKYPGIDAYSLAMAFSKAKEITLWPRIVVPFSPLKLKTFYLTLARRLTQRVFKGKT